jgi:hypothetical protein
VRAEAQYDIGRGGTSTWRGTGFARFIPGPHPCGDPIGAADGESGARRQITRSKPRPKEPAMFTALSRAETLAAAHATYAMSGAR